MSTNNSFVKTIHLLYFFYQRHHYYILAYKNDNHEKPGIFSVTKIRKVDNIGKYFDVPANFKISDYIKKEKKADVSPTANKLYHFELYFSKEIASEAIEKTYYHNQHIKLCEDGTVIVSFRSTQIDGVYHWVLRQGHKVKVLNPPNKDFFQSLMNNSYKERMNYFNKCCSITDLELYACEFYYKITKCFNRNMSNEFGREVCGKEKKLLEEILGVRRTKMNRNFTWTENYKNQLLELNEKVMNGFSMAYKKAENIRQEYKSSFQKDMSGLPVYVMVDEMNCWEKTGRFRRIKFQGNKADKYDFRTMYSMSIEKKPRILVKDAQIDLTDKELQQVKDFVSKHRKLLISMAKGNIDLIDFTEKTGLCKLRKNKNES